MKSKLVLGLSALVLSAGLNLARCQTNSDAPATPAAAAAAPEINWAAYNFNLPSKSSPEVQWWRDSRTNLDQRLAWWRDARFGMFIHWGVYSGLGNEFHGKKGGGYAEHIQRILKIPIPVYRDEVAANFNPTHFDADAWVRLARDTGMKYIVITAKHHDGFAMFDTEASDWNIVQASPFGRDPLKELAAACKKEGIKLGFYYSQAQDWNNGGSASGGKWDPAQQHDMDDYIDKIAVPQVKEILSNYGKFPAVLWWDTPINMNSEPRSGTWNRKRAANTHRPSPIMPRPKYGMILPARISPLRTGVTNSASMVPRSHSRAITMAVNSAPMVVITSMISPGTRK